MLKIIATIGSIQILAIAVNVVRSKTIAVLLGPEGVGIISVIDQLIMLIVQLSAFSLPFAAVKFLSRAHSQSLERFRDSYSNLLQLLALLSAVGAAIGLFIVFGYPQVLGAELQPYRSLITVGVITIPLIPLQGFLKNVLAAAQRPKASAFMDVGIAIALTTCVCVGVFFQGAVGFYWGNLVAGCLIVISALVFLQRELHLPLLGKRHNIFQELQKNPDIVEFSLIMYGSAFLYPLGMLVARHSVFKELGHEAAGLLQAAFAISSVLNLILNPANGLYLTPILNRDIPKAEKFRASLEFQRKLMLAIGILAMPMVLFASWTVILLFSPSFVSVGQFIFLFIISQCIIQLAGVYQALMIGLDDLKLYALFTTTGHFLFGLLSWYLVPEYGLMGVGISQVVANSTVFFSMLIYLTLKHGLTLSSRLKSSIAYGLVSILLAAKLFAGLDGFSPWLISGKLGVYGLFLIGLFLLLTLEERRTIMRKAEQLVTNRKL